MMEMSQRRSQCARISFDKVQNTEGTNRIGASWLQHISSIYSAPFFSTGLRTSDLKHSSVFA